MTLAHWSTHERPREKLLKQGAHALSNTELLAILLRTGIKGKSVIDFSQSLMQKFGTIRGLLEASPEALHACNGLGQAKCAEIKVIVEIIKRYLAETIEYESVLTDTQSTRHYLTCCLRNREQEVFACLFLNSQCHLIRYEELFYGTINEAKVYPREVVKRALQLNASAIILAHNHPSGDSTPSQADQLVTEKIKLALATIDVRVLDHFVIGEGNISSFAEKGWI
jgi:DNA repair protein RadC